jgi:hypothetical protein
MDGHRVEWTGRRLVERGPGFEAKRRGSSRPPVGDAGRCARQADVRPVRSQSDPQRRLLEQVRSGALNGLGNYTDAITYLDKALAIDLNAHLSMSPDKTRQESQRQASGDRNSKCVK